MLKSEKIGVCLVSVLILTVYAIKITENAELTLMLTTFWIVIGCFTSFIPKTSNIDVYIDDFSEFVLFVGIGPLFWIAFIIVCVARKIDTGSFLEENAA